MLCSTRRVWQGERFFRKRKVLPQHIGFGKGRTTARWLFFSASFLACSPSKGRCWEGFLPQTICLASTRRVWQGVGTTQKRLLLCLLAPDPSLLSSCLKRSPATGLSDVALHIILGVVSNFPLKDCRCIYRRGSDTLSPCNTS